MFDSIYTVFYCIFMIGFHFYKGYGGLTYPPIIWALETLGLVFLSIVQAIRIYFGFYANRQESQKSAGLFCVLTFLSLLVIIHSSFLQTYVLLIEILFGAIIGAICVMELILSLVAMRRFRAIMM
jgi:hypothetical protein